MTPRPVPLAIVPDNIPQRLKDEPRWVGWRYVWEDKHSKWTKVPYCARNVARKASIRNAKTWSTFDEALAAYQRGEVDGIGFVPSPVYFTLDIDHCLRAGVLAPDLVELVQRLGTYADISPGGDGLHVIGLGAIPGTQRIAKQNGYKYELFGHDRYITVTGRTLDGLPTTVESVQPALDGLYEQLFSSNGTGAPAATPSASRSTDDEVLEMAFAAKNGAKFRQLYDGDSSGYQSPSEADAAFGLMLAFWTGRDTAQMERLVRRSGRNASHWTSPSYTKRTIDWAIRHCHTVYHSSHTEPPPAPRIVPPRPLSDVHAIFRQWLGDSYDVMSLNAVLATAAAEQLLGDPLWLLVLGGPSTGKTEVLRALEGAGALITSTIQSEGSLLSGSPRREHTKDSTGGLLRRIGTHGIIVLKDVTTVLSMNRDQRGPVLAALREIHDGKWERNIGTNGGRTLCWEGRIALIGGVTAAWDQAYEVIASMGDRFVLVRLNSYNDREESGYFAICNTGHEGEMRSMLADAVASILLHVDPETVPALTEAEQFRLIRAANLTTLCRTSVVFDYQGRPIDAHVPEGPARLSKQLAQLFRGGLAIGLTRREAMTLAIRCARDSMPPLRLAILEDVAQNPVTTVQEVRKRLDKPRSTVDRQMQAMQLLQVLTLEERVEAEDTQEETQTKTRWYFSVADRIDASALSPDLSDVYLADVDENTDGVDHQICRDLERGGERIGNAL